MQHYYLLFKYSTHFFKFIRLLCIEYYFPGNMPDTDIWWTEHTWGLLLKNYHLMKLMKPYLKLGMNRCEGLFFIYSTNIYLILKCTRQCARSQGIWDKLPALWMAYNDNPQVFIHYCYYFSLSSCTTSLFMDS